MKANGSILQSGSHMKTKFKVGDLVRVRLAPTGRPNEGVIISLNKEGVGFAEPLTIYYVMLYGAEETVPCIAGELEAIHESR